MGARTKARKKALDRLFEAEQRGVNAAELLGDRVSSPVTQTPLPDYTRAIVTGVVREWVALGDVLTTYAQGWTLDRMPAVDRTILRIGAWEILYSDDVPDKVAISEAVSLAADLSTDDSPKFVSGLLGRVAEVKPTLV